MRSGYRPDRAALRHASETVSRIKHHSRSNTVFRRILRSTPLADERQVCRQWTLLLAISLRRDHHVREQ